jgi:GDP-D-mannose 3',5'-epimerase
MYKSFYIFGGHGFIGSHLAKRLNDTQSGKVITVDKQLLPYPSLLGDRVVYRRHLDLSVYSSQLESLHEEILADLADTSIDEVQIYQLAADMGGAGYIFTGDHDFSVMTESVSINVLLLRFLESLNPFLRSKLRVFYSSSACIYPERNQMDPDNPYCAEDSAYPADPDSEYGWEKLFSERLYFTASRNLNLNVRVARFHNIFGPYGSWNNGREKSPAAICRKIAEESSQIDIWGDGNQTRSFLYIEDCLDAVLALMTKEEVSGPLNIGSEELISINGLASMVMKLANREKSIRHIPGPLGVRGRCSDNREIERQLGWKPKFSLEDGMKILYSWISSQISDSSNLH